MARWRRIGWSWKGYVGLLRARFSFFDIGLSEGLRSSPMASGGTAKCSSSSPRATIGWGALVGLTLDSLECTGCLVESSLFCGSLGCLLLLLSYSLPPREVAGTGELRRAERDVDSGTEAEV